MARQKENSEKVLIYLSIQDLTALRKQAKDEGSSVSQIVRRLVKAYLAGGAHYE